MPLSPGQRLGPYEIQSPIGAGGMGEVYRARDTRLDRAVAIKVLPAHLSSSPELRQRFEREARAISALNHPHICTLHDIGSQDGVDFLVMEYLEGETLADRLRKGPVPIEQVAKIGSDIADALDAAHRQGIVHRDLKPGNIMLGKSGAKLMDFGLAKPVAGAGAASSKASGPTLSAAITRTSPGPQDSPLTSAGAIVGTIQYMSPEQIEGREADPRSDIFAFGAVLYEMATGRRAFEGKTQLGVASAILEKEPEPLGTAQPAASPALEDMVRTCLAKDPEDRYASAHDIRLLLRRLPADKALPAKAGRPSKWPLWTGVALALAAAAVAAVSLLRNPERPAISAEIVAPPGTTYEMTGDQGAPAVLSPDGRYLVAGAGGRLWLRQIADGSYSPLEGTAGAAFPFWSPDSRNVGFFANAKLQRIAIAGGGPVVVCGAESARGGSWGRDNIILFTPSVQTPVLKVAADGGTPVPVTTLDTKVHSTHRWPFFLPDGRHFLYLATNHGNTTGAENGIFIGSADGKENRRLMQATGNAIYSAGYLLYVQQNELMARRFDPNALKLTGEPFRLRRKVYFDGGIWRNLVSASDAGLLLYLSAVADLTGKLMWVSDSGQTLSTLGDSDKQSPRLSPDGRRIALEKGDPNSDIWIHEVNGPIRVRFTSTGRNYSPVWSPDGRQLVFAMIGSHSVLSSAANMVIAPVNGPEAAQPIAPSKTYQNPTDWSRDGKFILFENGDPGVSELWATEARPGSVPFSVLQSHTRARDGHFSPDGKWAAYASDESGHYEVYVTPFPGPGPRFQISTGGGEGPRWRQDAREIYFYTPAGAMMAVFISVANGEVRAGNSRKLFQAKIGLNTFSSPAYDVTGDGKKFLIYGTGDSNAPPLALNLVTDWRQMLK